MRAGIPTDKRFFGIGIVRADPREAMVDAAELCARIVRSFGISQGGTDFTPIPFLVAAERHAVQLSNGDTLHLFVLPWPAPIEAPPGCFAVFAASTRRWKKGQAPLIEAVDAFVDDFVRRQQWPLEQINLARYPHTEPHLYFSYQIFVSALPATMRPTER